MTETKPNTKRKFEDYPVISHTLNWSKSYSPPGFKKATVYQVIYFLYNEARRNDLNMRASAMTYDFFMAIFPSLIFLFTLTAYFPAEWDFYKVLEQSVISILPPGAKEYVVTDIINSLRPQAKGSFLSIGFILALWFGSEGIIAMMRGFDKTYKSNFRKRKWTEIQLTAISITFGLGLILILSILLIIFGQRILQWILDFIHLSALLQVSITVLKYIIIFVLMYTVIALMYRHGPAIKKNFKWFSPGAFLATITSIITSILFGIFIDKFGSYHKVYGAISALIITLLWIRFNTLILILGFELHAAILVKPTMLNEAQIHKTLVAAEKLEL